MHRRVFLFVLMAVFLFSFVLIQSPTSARPPYAGTPGPGLKGIVVASDALRIRIKPDTTSAETGSPLKPKSTVVVLGRDTDGVWLVVQTPGGVYGWVSSAYVQLMSGSMKDLPIMDDSAVPNLMASASTAEAPVGTECPPSGSGTPAPVAGVKGIVVSSDGLVVRSQPLTNAPEVANPLKLHDTVTVVGRDTDGVWLVIQTRAGIFGWVSSAYVQMPSGSLKNTPVMDAGTAVDTLTAQASAATSEACPPEGTPAPTAATPATGLKGIVVASEGLVVRTIPNVTSPAVGSPLKSKVSVIVLGRDFDGVWLYIQTLAGDKGWVSSAYVQLMSGSMKDLPKLDESGNPM